MNRTAVQGMKIMTPSFLLVSRRGFSTQSGAQLRVNVSDLHKKYNDRRVISMVTAYDYSSAREVERAGIDILLVGDSLGMVMMGRKSTTSVTMDEMIHHCRAVSRGSSKIFTVADLPFGSYEVSKEAAVSNAIRLIKEGEVSAIKLEGGRKMKDHILAITNAGIPVMGHIGLTPQTSPAQSGYRVQGKTAQDAADIYLDALALQDAGCFGLVIESVPELLGEKVTRALRIPTFGIGAGRHTSGQVLVYHDLLGLYPDFVPKFCKQYAKLSDEIHKGLTEFKKEVENKEFPTPAHTYSMKEEEWDKANEIIQKSLHKEEDELKEPSLPPQWAISHQYQIRRTKEGGMVPPELQFIDFDSLDELQDSYTIYRQKPNGAKKESR